MTVYVIGKASHTRLLVLNLPGSQELYAISDYKEWQRPEPRVQGSTVHMHTFISYLRL